MAQGGVAAVLDLENDSYELHIKDSMIAGIHANDTKTVSVTVRAGGRSAQHFFNSNPYDGSEEIPVSEEELLENAQIQTRQNLEVRCP